MVFNVMSEATRNKKPLTAPICPQEHFENSLPWLQLPQHVVGPCVHRLRLHALLLYVAQLGGVIYINRVVHPFDPRIF